MSSTPPRPRGDEPDPTPGHSSDPPLPQDPQPAPPPVADPPVADPPVADPPVADPPVADPPVADPPVADPPAPDPLDSPPRRSAIPDRFWWVQYAVGLAVLWPRGVGPIL